MHLLMALVEELGEGDGGEEARDLEGGGWNVSD